MVIHWWFIGDSGVSSSRYLQVELLWSQEVTSIPLPLNGGELRQVMTRDDTNGAQNGARSTLGTVFWGSNNGVAVFWQPIIQDQ